jgi:nicotinamide riboside kinase
MEDTITITPWQYRHDSMRIGIAGASGLGKTTLAKGLAEWMQYPYVPGGYREMVGNKHKDDMDDKAIMRLHLDLMNQKKLMEHGKTEFVSDRTLMDHAAYLLRNLGTKKEFQRGCDDYIADAMIYSATHYDIVFMLPFGQFEVTEEDEHRSMDMPAMRAMTQMMIESMVFQHGPALLAYQVKSPTVEDRIAECVEIIDRASQVKAKTYAQMTKQAINTGELTKPKEAGIN